MRRWILPALALAASIATAGPLPDEPHVVVSGSHTVEAAPDILRLTLSLIHVDRDVAVARENVDSRSAELIGAVKQLGVKKKDISSTSLSVVPRYNWNNREQIYQGTEVSRRIEIILRDLEKYDELMKAVVGAQVGRIENTVLESSRREELLAQALKGAVADAREKAELLASGIQARLGGVFSVSSTSAQPVYRGPQMEAFRASAQQAGAFEPGLISFTESVSVVFYLARE